MESICPPYHRSRHLRHLRLLRTSPPAVLRLKDDSDDEHHGQTVPDLLVMAADARCGGFS